MKFQLKKIKMALIEPVPGRYLTSYDEGFNDALDIQSRVWLEVDEEKLGKLIEKHTGVLSINLAKVIAQALPGLLKAVKKEPTP